MFGVGIAEKIANFPVYDVNGKRWTLLRYLGKSRRFVRSHYDLFMYANLKLKLDSSRAILCYVCILVVGRTNSSSEIKRDNQNDSFIFIYTFQNFQYILNSK